VSELGSFSRYGLISKEKAAELEKLPSSGGMFVRVFSENEDRQWRNGVIISKAKSTRRSPNTVFDREAKAIEAKVEQARQEGLVPFRIAGPDTKVSRFLHNTGIAEVDLVPECLNSAE
jgi:hypothetical protein